MVTGRRPVLIIAYHFPPDGAVGAIRPGKFAKFLQGFHWDPIVLTIPDDRVRVRDESRLHELNGVPIVRAPVFATPLEIAVRLKAELREFRSRVSRVKSERHRSKPGSAQAAKDLPTERHGTRGPVLRWLDALFEFPDKQVGWLLPALWRAVQLIREHRIEVVIATAPPRTALVIAYLACFLTGAALVLDFRDPWQMQVSPGSRRADWQGSRALWWLERRLVRYASLIVTTTPEHADDLRTRFPDLPSGRIETILNGFDADDVRHLRRRAPDRRFVISYLGTFYLERTPALVLEVLADLVQRGVVGRDELIVKLIGHVENAKGDPVREMVDRLGLSSATVISGPVPYREALQIMAESDALLLLAPAQYYSIPAKAFDYLGVGVPIICIADEGATSRLIRASGAGPVIAPADRDGLRRALESLLMGRGGAWDSGSAECRSTFERRPQVGRLAALLDHVVRRECQTVVQPESRIRETL